MNHGIGWDTEDTSDPSFISGDKNLGDWTAFVASSRTLSAYKCVVQRMQSLNLDPATVNDIRESLADDEQTRIEDKETGSETEAGGETERGEPVACERSLPQQGSHQEVGAAEASAGHRW
ncbi:hypothetical protein AMECASPLE_035807, partial [Ameca splendens]